MTEAEGTGAIPEPAASADPGRSLVVDTPVAKPLPKRDLITRRVLILGGFWTALGLAIVGILGSPLDFIWPRNVKGFGGPINVTPDRIPEPGGDPIVIPEGRFFVLNMEPGKTEAGDDTPGGVLALWRKCPHLGCTVPYNPSFDFLGKKGWFRCPCHNSTYTKDGGVLVFGPAPRSLDVFPLEVQDDLSLVVQTGRQFEGSGSPDNPLRAVPLEPGSTTPDA
jgi:cytochrome b6-f complex iron-sulfur subunit